MMKTFLFMIVLLSFVGCNKSVEPIREYYSEIKGVVVVGNNKELLDSVLVGFKNLSIPDSLIFIGDSISIDVLNDSKNLSPFMAPFVFSVKGQFQFGFAFAAKPPVHYEQMFAYKAGKKLWRFDSTKDTVFHLNANIDSIMIRMLIQ